MGSGSVGMRAKAARIWGSAKAWSSTPYCPAGYESSFEQAAPDCYLTVRMGFTAMAPPSAQAPATV
jgi:hypothetical protein